MYPLFEVEGTGVICLRTFRVVLHGILQVLHDPLLPDDLLNFCLGLDVERIRVQGRNLSLPLRPLPALPVSSIAEGGSEALRVVQHACKLWLCPLQFCPVFRVAQDLQAEELGVGLVGCAGGILLLLHLLWCGAVVWVCGNAGAAAHVSDVEGKHLAVGYG